MTLDLVRAEVAAFLECHLDRVDASTVVEDRFRDDIACLVEDAFDMEIPADAEWRTVGELADLIDRLIRDGLLPTIAIATTRQS